MRFELDLLKYDEIHSEIKSNGRHYKTPIGTFPSVTTVLSASSNKDWLEGWKNRVGQEEAKRIVEEAGNRGSKFHDLNEKYLLNQDIDWKRIDPMTRAHFIQIRKWLDENISVVYGSEIPVYSRKLKCAGRTDAIVRVNDEIVVLDFKTSKHEKEEVEDYRMQCSAYVYMMNEMFDLKIQNYIILVSNLFENHSSVFTGNYKDHIQSFAETRKKWQDFQTT